MDIARQGDLGVRWQMPELESVTIDGELDIGAEDFRYFEEQISDLMIVKKGSDYAGEILDRLRGNSSVDVEGEKDQFTSRLNQTGTSSDSQRRLPRTQLRNRNKTARGRYLRGGTKYIKDR